MLTFNDIRPCCTAYELEIDTYSQMGKPVEPTAYKVEVSCTACGYKVVREDLQEAIKAWNEDPRFIRK